MTVRSLFERAAACAGEERARLLEEARRTVPEVCAEVEALLRYHDRAGAVLDRSPVEAAPGERAEGTSSEPVATPRVRGYTVLGPLGAGGMGVVHEARQESPPRTVALKVLRPGLLSPSSAKRFSQEAAALARLQHPGIAQVYEVGMAGPGDGAAPFIAMELVRGEPLTRYADARELTTRERLDLIARVCDAVEHAHRRGVIHRDLKPANILVDERGQPKVLDFGVARLTDAEARVTTMSTSVGQILGTLAYMSPEQAAGDPGAVDERTDVYALGVLTYELLCGRLPIETDNVSVPRALEAIARHEPRPLSAIERRLRGDLETIIGRALEKDRSRRYQSAADLAADIRRHLAHQPIAARAPSTLYLVRKFVRRHRPLVAGGAAAVVALVAGLAGTSWQAVLATRASDRAEQEAAVAREANGFLRRLLASADPANARGRELTVREVLDEAERELDASPPASPAVRVVLHDTLADAYLGVGENAKAERHGAAAHRLALEHFGPEHRASLEAAVTLGAVLLNADRLEELRDLTGPALAIAERVLGEEDEASVQLLNQHAMSLAGEQERTESERLMRLALERSARAFGPESARTLVIRSNLGLHLAEWDRPDEAIPLLETTLEARRRLLSEAHPETLVSMLNLVMALDRADRLEEAHASAAALLPLAERVWGHDHPGTDKAEMNLAMLALRTGRTEAALPRLLSVHERRARVSGEDDPETLYALGGYAMATIMARRLDEAEPLIEELHRRSAAAYGEDHVETLRSLTLYYDLYEARGEREKMAQVAARLKGSPFDPAGARPE